MDSKLLNYAKSPIPVLNSTSPRNYVIMSALLSHQFNSLSEPSSTQAAPSVQCTNTITQDIVDELPSINKNVYFLNGCRSLNQLDKNHIISKGSKSIIYTSKRIRLQTEPKLAANNNDLIDLLETDENNNKNNKIQFINNLENHLYPSNSVVLPISTSSLEKEPLDNSLNKPRVVIIEANNATIENQAEPSSQIDLATHASSFINNVEEEASRLITLTSIEANSKYIETDSFINDSIQDSTQSAESLAKSEEKTTTVAAYEPAVIQLPLSPSRYASLMSDYTNLFIEPQQSAIEEESSITNVNHLNKEIHQSDAVVLSPEEKESSNLVEEINPNTQIEYAISCTSDFYSKITHMLSCYVQLERCALDRVISEKKIKLRCAVCMQQFSTLNQLETHKENNDDCKNDIQIDNKERSYSAQEETVSLNPNLAELQSLEQTERCVENQDERLLLAADDSIRTEEASFLNYANHLGTLQIKLIADSVEEFDREYSSNETSGYFNYYRTASRSFSKNERLKLKLCKKSNKLIIVNRVENMTTESKIVNKINHEQNIQDASADGVDLTSKEIDSTCVTSISSLASSKAKQSSRLFDLVLPNSMTSSTLSSTSNETPCNKNSNEKESESSDTNNKSTRTRRKYNRSKSNGSNNLTCESNSLIIRNKL
jgi:hypothetical protein